MDTKKSMPGFKDFSFLDGSGFRVSAKDLGFRVQGWFRVLGFGKGLGL